MEMVDRVRLKKEVVRHRPPAVDAEQPSGDERIDVRSLYKPEYDKIAQMLCSYGAVDRELADAFDVNINTIANWQLRHPSFASAMAYGKSAVFDPRVERSMAQLAIGYSMDVEEVKVTKDGDIVRYNIRKQLPPNVTACIFWLKNRQPDKWRDVYDHKHSGKVGWENMTADQMRAEIMKEASELGLELPMSKVKTRGSNGVAPPPNSKLN